VANSRREKTIKPAKKTKQELKDKRAKGKVTKPE
jgi:hypothetical protein